MFALWQKDNIPIQELAQRTALGKSTLTRMLDKLEETGHIIRTFPDEDRRKTLIQLTEGNKKMGAAYEGVSRDMINLYYRGFNESEMNQFEEYLGRIFENLSRFANEHE